MSLDGPQARHPKLFDKINIWVDPETYERPKVLSKIEGHGGTIVPEIRQAHYIIAPTNMSDMVRRESFIAKVPTVVQAWMHRCVEANQILPINDLESYYSGDLTSEELERATVAAAARAPPVSTLQKEPNSLSGESTSVESPAPAASFQHARTSGDTSSISQDSPTDPNFDSTIGDGESEVDELDQSALTDGEAKRRRGKAYSKEDIEAMQKHFKQQMELTPRPSHSAIWETFAYNHPYRKASSWQQYFYNHKSLFMSGKAAASAPSTPVPQTQTQSSQPQPDTTAEPSPPIAVPAIPKITIPATISLPPPVPLPPQVKRPAPRQSEGQEAWDDDDETALITFLAANSQRNQIPVNEWHALALQTGKSRTGRSYMMKYHKNRIAYDIKSGRQTPPQYFPREPQQTWYGEPAGEPVAATKQTAFVPLATESAPVSLKRSRPAEFETIDGSTDRPVRARTLQQSYAEDGDDVDDDDEEMRDEEIEPSFNSRAVPTSPSTPMDFTYASTSTPAKAAVHQPTAPRPSMSNGVAPSPSPAIGTSSSAAWMTPFTPEDKADALRWVVSRSQPVDFLDNLKSWVEFAETHPSHSPQEWVCHYLSHYPTFQSVESNLGAF